MFRFFIKTVFVFLLIINALGAYSQMERLTGTVTDHRGEPIVGALVQLDNTSKATLTTTDGEFLLEADRKYRGYKVIVSYSGFKSDTSEFKGTNWDVSLSPRDRQRIETYTVSTQNRLQSDIDVPIAITVLGSRDQRNFNLDQIDDMSHAISGFMSQVISSDYGAFGIRGVATDGVYSYERVRVSVYKDEVPCIDLRGSVVEMFDIDRVEVVKGPQSTLFGKGAEFGAVHYITNQPSNVFSLNAKVGTGSYGRRTAEAIVNTPFSNMKFANRLGIHYDYHDGFVKNLAGGRLNGKNAIAIKEALSYSPNERQIHTATFNYERDREPSISYKSNRIGPQSTGSTSPFTAAEFTGGAGQKVDRDITSFSLRSSFNRGGNLEFTNILAYNRANSYHGFDLDGTYINIINTRYHTWCQSFSEEFRGSWRSGDRLSGFFGVSANYDQKKVQSVHYGDFHKFSAIVLSENIEQNMGERFPAQVADGVDLTVMAVADTYKEAVGPELWPIVENTLRGVLKNTNEAIQAKLKEKMNEWFHSGAEEWTRTPDFAMETSQLVGDCIKAELEESRQKDPMVNTIIQQISGGMELSDWISSLRPLMMESLQDLIPYSNVDFKNEKNLSENEMHYNNIMASDLFADVSYELVKDKLFLTAGLRGTYEYQKSGYSSTSNEIPILGHMLFHPSGPHGEEVTVDKSYLSWAGRGIINYMVDSTHNLYFSVSKGRSPGDIHFDQRPDSIIDLRPEQIINYELGFKGRSRWGNFYYYAAFFYYDWRNFQSSVSTNVNSVLGFASSDHGKARGFGMDGQVLYTLNRNLSFLYDLALLNGKFSNKDVNGNAQTLAGKHFTMSPECTMDFGINWYLFFSPSKFIHVHPLVSYIGTMYFSSDNDPLLCQNGYWLADINMGYTWRPVSRNTRFEIGLYAKNIANTKYLVSAGNGGSWFGFPTFVSGRPFTAGVVFRVSI